MNVFDRFLCISYSFFLTHTSTPEIYTLSLHDALPISWDSLFCFFAANRRRIEEGTLDVSKGGNSRQTSILRLFRSEEHTSELQSRRDLVCRLLLEKKKQQRHDTVHRRTEGASG